MNADDSHYLRLNSGPHNSSAHGLLRIKVASEGETVRKADPEVGYLHRGIEKIAERVSWVGFSPFTDRVDYLSAIHCNLAYAMAVETVARIQVSPRAGIIRVIAGELNRIASHLYLISSLASRLGATTAAMYMIRDRESINNLFEMLCGSRLTYNYVRIGGVAHDITEGFIERTVEALDEIEPRMAEYDDLLLKNGIFEGRLRGLGRISAEDALGHGLTGPNLRASGVDWDLRVKSPYCGYEKYAKHLQASRNITLAGDSLSRVVLRLLEIRESVALVRDALDDIPPGPYKEPLPLKFAPPAGEAYAVVESPRGVFGVYVRSNGGKSPDRVRLRAPSVAAVSLLPHVLRDVQLGDIPSVVGSLDIMISEVDR